MGEAISTTEYENGKISEKIFEQKNDNKKSQMDKQHVKWVVDTQRRSSGNHTSRLAQDNTLKR